jgi:spoIIIJ-associated protein
MAEINENTIDLLKETINEVLAKMGVSGTIFSKITESSEGEETITLNIKTLDADILIGRNGDNLFALQHLIRILFRKKNGEIIPFILDINNYKKEKEERLQGIAQFAAEKVKKTGKEVALRPMPAYERRIIHVFLAREKQLITESEGEDPNRRIVVRPQP